MVEMCESGSYLPSSTVHKDGNDAEDSSEYVLTCPSCELWFSSKVDLDQHEKEEHPKLKKIQCDQCNYQGTKRALSVHRSKKHRDQSRANQVCQELLDDRPCAEAFFSVVGLRHHLAMRHSMDAATHCLVEEFKTLDEFQSWKSQYEVRSGAVYNIATSRPKKGTTACYLCSRSGVYTPADCRKRRLKSQGTCKLGRRCTSDLAVTTREDGTVLVKMHTFHYGHGLDDGDVPHVRIPSAHKAIVKEKLLSGVPVSRIIKDARESAGGDSGVGTSRIALLRRKDVLNMCQSLGITAAPDRAARSRKRKVRERECAEGSSSLDQLSAEESASSDQVAPQLSLLDTRPPDVVPRGAPGSAAQPADQSARGSTYRRRVLAKYSEQSARISALPDDVLAQVYAKLREVDQLTAQAAIADSHGLPAAIGDSHGLRAAIGDSHGLPAAIGDSHGLPAAIGDSHGLPAAIGDSHGLPAAIGDSHGLRAAAADTEEHAWNAAACQPKRARLQFIADGVDGVLPWDIINPLSGGDVRVERVPQSQPDHSY
ncbi:uncharacterized protein LOC119096967 [Pollicipes pollicipes]|uniref:uncharacterized protein LOC119096967 n=1 Tax=Pollicipes pollicipes TaxID=41117 RepID=UPI0018859B75|nr:uncharacterized protein LOC119096967 [Pollicipes pollicipes]